MFRICFAAFTIILQAAASASEPALFTETFGREAGLIGRNNQAQSALPIKHAHELPGWVKKGAGMPAHFVELYPGNWAFMIVANRPDQNIFTQKVGVDANIKGHVYAVSFDAGPGVYAALSQATAAGDQLAVALLRADGSVLKEHAVAPGKWTGRCVLKNFTFSYTGDGSGPLRFRISPVYTSGTRFYGAMDNLQIFRSAKDAGEVVARRRTREKRLAEKAAARMASLTPMEKDWLFQAGSGGPSLERTRQEIAWTRELAERLLNGTEAPDLGSELKSLDAIEAKLKSDADDPYGLYFQVRRIKRRITFKNPAVNFSSILLIDNPYPKRDHETSHRHGYRAAGHGRLLVLEGLNPDSPVRSLVPEEKRGFLWRPDLSFDAQRIVFCMKPEQEKSYHLYEVKVDGGALKQLTFGDYDDLDPIYLPNGKIMFTSTRAHTYIRCGPSHHAPVLARCDGDGKNIYIISQNNEADFLPTLLENGRVLYTRWEYTDKEQKRVQALWTVNPDGTEVRTFWGNQSVWPDILAEPRAIPGSHRIMFTGVGHHLWFDGCIGIVDPLKGLNYPDGLTKVTQEIPWPEVGNGPRDNVETRRYHRAGRYAACKTPYPISREDFLVSITPRRKGQYSLYLMDIYGNRELIYTGRHNAWHAMPLRPRKKPPAIPDRVAWPDIGADQKPPQDGIMFSADVFEGAPLLPRDRVKFLRVVQIDAKTYSSWVKTYQHSGPSISITQADGVKRILGTTPVEADGSVCFKVPPGKALHFQLLDKDYRCLQTMRSFVGVMPGEVRGCVGCHEGQRSAAGNPVPSRGGMAMRRGALDLTPPPWGAGESISYERFVQPVLDRYCGECHQGEGKARKKLDLTLRHSSVAWAPAAQWFKGLVDAGGLPDGDPWKALRPSTNPSPFKEPYVTLIGGGNDWYHPVGGKGLINEHGLPVSIAGCLIVEGYHERTPAALATLNPMTHMSSASKLIRVAMDETHIKKRMDPVSLRRLIAWVDANGPYLGEEEIRRMPDPTFTLLEPVPVRPRLKTAPRINRFNIRQDGDSSKIILEADGPRYPTPEACPRFAQPEFISRPLEKAYPGIAYNIRPAVRGGTYPYRFTLEKAPGGMAIDAAKGTVTWAAPSRGTHPVAIKAVDTAGRTATQRFTVNVSKSGFYFVSPEGDDAGPGTLEKPWRTVMRAAGPPAEFTYPAGAIVYIRHGTHAVKVPPKPGRKNANVLRIDRRSPMYWIAYPGEKPVIDLGWSERRHRAAQAEQVAAGKVHGKGKEGSAMDYGHRVAFAGDYLYMDGLEVKNACYYMFVMWDGGKTVHFRRMNMHHLWADWAENPGFIFTYAAGRKGDFNAWGIRPECNAYRRFVIQENRFHHRFYIRDGRGGHGGGFTFYTVHDSLIEDNEFRDIQRGECFNDKDNGLGNTYRGNVILGDCSLLGQWCTDETEVCHNYIAGRLRIGLQPGWVRNIWIHHNAIKGNVSLMGGGTRRPDRFDASKGDYAGARTADTARAIRDFPAGKRLIHFYRNVIDAPAVKIGDRQAGVIAAIPNHQGFADRWRYVRWDENLVDVDAKVELLWNRFTDFSIFKRCGFDKNGIRAPVELDREGRLPAGSPHRRLYGVNARTGADGPEPFTLWEPGKPMPRERELAKLDNVAFHVIKPYEFKQDGYRFLHGVALIWHKGRLFASFGRNKGGENTDSEEAHYCISDDAGKTWGPVGVIDAGAPGIAVSHGEFLSHKGTLWAFHGSYRGIMEDLCMKAYVFDEENEKWLPKGVVSRDRFWSSQNPIRMDNGNWVMAGFIVNGHCGQNVSPAAVAISRGDVFTGWDVVSIPAPAVKRMWGESGVIVQGGRLVNIARWGEKPVAIAAASDDYGRTWRRSGLSNMKMDATKPYPGMLSTGQRFLVGTTHGDCRNSRSPLTIAVSRPGEAAFSRIFKIRDSVFPEGPGESHPGARLAYPHAVEHDGKLYIGYSNSGGGVGRVGKGRELWNNNSAELAVIPVGELKVE